MEPSLHDISMQKISNGEQAHPLMMGHPASYQLMTCPPEPAPGRTIVRSFVEAIFAEPTQIGHSPQIPLCARPSKDQFSSGVSSLVIATKTPVQDSVPSRS